MKQCEDCDNGPGSTAPEMIPLENVVPQTTILKGMRRNCILFLRLPTLYYVARLSVKMEIYWPVRPTVKYGTCSFLLHLIAVTFRNLMTCKLLDI